MGNKSKTRSASPQERHLLRAFIIGAILSRVATTCTKLPIDAPKKKNNIEPKIITKKLNYGTTS